MISYIVLSLLYFYTAFFLLYLVVRFSNFERHQVHDDLLGKEVPAMVYIQNQALAKEYILLTLESDDAKKQHLKLTAEINENMFYILRRNGVSACMDEAISTGLVDIDKIRLQIKSEELEVRTTLLLKSDATSGTINSSYSAKSSVNAGEKSSFFDPLSKTEIEE